MNYRIEDLKNTWQFPFNKSKEIIKDIFSIIQKYAKDDILKKYRDYIKKILLKKIILLIYLNLFLIHITKKIFILI